MDTPFRSSCEIAIEVADLALAEARVRRRMSGPAVALALLLVITGAGSAQQPAPSHQVLGRWRGTSTCIKAAWNAACNDEQVIYRFTPAAAPANHLTLNAEKVIGGVPEPMYDLDLVFNAAAGAWGGDFTNARVHILWEYRVTGTRLTGRLVDLRTGRLLRRVAAVRDSA